MTARERLARVLSRRPVDRPPVLCPGGMMTVWSAEVLRKAGFRAPGAHVCARSMASAAERVAGITGFECAGVPFSMTHEAQSLGASVDLGDGRREPVVRAYPCPTPGRLARLRPPDPEGDGPLLVLLEALDRLRGRALPVPVVGNLTGPLTLATCLVEPGAFLRAMRRDPGTVHEVLSALTGFLIDLGRAQARAGAELLAVSDPTATGEILGPDLFERFARPHLARLCRALAREGRPVLLHICGRVGRVLGSVAAVGGVSVFSFDAPVDPADVRARLPATVVPMGNVSTWLLERGSPARVAGAARACLARGVGILAPACGIGSATPLENLRALTGAVDGAGGPP